MNTLQLQLTEYKWRQFFLHRTICLIKIFMFWLPASALTQNMVCDTTIIKAFHQGSGKARNCASISVIKLSMSVYGHQGVFLKVDTLENSFRVLLRNRDTITLTRQELIVASKYDMFQQGEDKQIYNASRFFYAVMAKRKQVEKKLKSIKKE